MTDRPWLRRSVNKKHFGPIIEWQGGACPVPSGTKVTVFYRHAAHHRHPYWTPANHPEQLEWHHSGGHKDILAYYVRYDFAAPPEHKQEAGAPVVPIPVNVDHAEAMIAVAQEWLGRHS